MTVKEIRVLWEETESNYRELDPVDGPPRKRPYDHEAIGVLLKVIESQDAVLEKTSEFLATWHGTQDWVIWDGCPTSTEIKLAKGEKENA